MILVNQHAWESYIQKAELTTSYSKEELEQVLNKLQLHFYSSGLL